MRESGWDREAEESGGKDEKRAQFLQKIDSEEGQRKATQSRKEGIGQKPIYSAKQDS